MYRCRRKEARVCVSKNAHAKYLYSDRSFDLTDLILISLIVMLVGFSITQKIMFKRAFRKPELDERKKVDGWIFTTYSAEHLCICCSCMLKETLVDSDDTSSKANAYCLIPLLSFTIHLHAVE